MLGKILFLIFLSVVIFSSAIGVVIFYHFKKFKLASDKFGRKLVTVFFAGTIVLVSFSLLFLLLALL